ncbi:ABC transporter permease subunit [Bacillus sp. P14.5]|uniref:ABC transporter permease n=1 Tax=Bacillus sp. P14.5 TaxID=1983400 RepID=UPI000DE8F6EF|nr:ABC transporter permease subunit [Bacillus sp. P14.5]
MWRKNKFLHFILPATVTMVILFYGGIFNGILQSAGYNPAAGQYEWSLQAYKALLSSEEFWKSLTLSLRVALLSSMFSAVLGMMAAICLVWLSGTINTQLLNRFFQLPLTIPHLVGAYLMVLLFMQSGWLSGILYKADFIDDPSQFPILVNEPFGWGMILAYVWKEAPFISLMVYPVLKRINESWKEVASVYGANPFQSFRYIMLPLVLPAWISAAFIVFAFTFSAFEVPFLLGVTYPKMLSVLSYEHFSNGGLENRPEAMAINLILAFITALLGLISYRLSRKWSKKESGWN